MITGIFKIWLKNCFKFEKASDYLVIFILILTAVFSGIVIGKIVDDNSIVVSSNKQVIDIILINKILLLITILRMVIPNYEPLGNLILDYHPVSVIKKFIINISIELLNKYFLFVFLFLLTISIVSKEFNTLILIQSVLFVLEVHLIRRIIQLIIENKYSSIISLFSLFSGMLIILIFLLSPPWIPGNLLSVSIILGLSILINILLSDTNHPVRSFSYINSLPLKGIFNQLLIFNNSVRISLIAGMLLKFSLLGIDLLLLKTRGRHLLDGNILYWIFIASPIIYFTYVYYNIWGYYRELWLKIRFIAANDWTAYFKIYLKLVYLPLLIDTSISLLILLILWDNKLFVLVYYLTAVLFLICFSFYWSFKNPVYQISSTIFKMSSSPKGNLICMFCMGILYLMSLTPILYLLVPLFFALSYMLILKARFNLINDKFEVYTHLFNH